MLVASPAFDLPSVVSCPDCVTDCKEPTCSAAEVAASGCTDQCVDIVVPCHDPAHETTQEPGIQCFFDCDAAAECTDCTTNFAAFCCEQAHSPPPDSQSDALPPWDLSWLCSDCNFEHSPVSSDAFKSMASYDTHSATFQSYTASQSSHPIPFGTQLGQGQGSVQQSMAHLQSIGHMDGYGSLRMSPQVLMNQDSVSQSRSKSASNPSTSATSAAPQPNTSHACMWADCSESFSSMTALVGHVNLKHLRLPKVSSTEPPSPAPSPVTSPANVPEVLSPSFSSPYHDPNNIFCLWRNCNVFSTPDSVPETFSGDTANSVRNVLANHLLHDHLGLDDVNPDLFCGPVTDSGSPSIAAPLANNYSRSLTSNSWNGEDGAPLSPPDSHIGSPSEFRDDSGGGIHNCALEVHRCRWESCGEIFSTCDDLTEHLGSAHVGSGRGQYECRWEGCDRRDTRAFTSKQKISRHLQTHTGHRPFQCTICNQNFSEAATLQQHMRRHTHERPYKCNHPGCGKSFSIKGALTIHERTHNGDKPFKCTYCDKAFSESSNLSKHLRTHTGCRPYLCKHEGCGKAFARPDQLSRHTSIHNKK